jgi:DNA-binding SARP family transcriptional activator
VVDPASHIGWRVDGTPYCGSWRESLGGGLTNLQAYETNWPILICLLGEFRLLKFGQPIPIRHGGKIKALLQSLALRSTYSVPREILLDRLWPNSPRFLASQSLCSVVYSLHKSLGDCIGGAAPVIRKDGSYCLNLEAGVGVDVQCFDSATEAGEQKVYDGDHEGATVCFRRAIAWYRGELCEGEEAESAIDRERLRARYLSLLARLADYCYRRGDYVSCVGYALVLLSEDPCREDAHRLAMRCYVRQGSRAQAFRQYRLCEGVLRAEFDALPEPATRTLFEQIRTDPESV